MKVFVLGHNGMLGHMVARYLEATGHTVVSSPHRYKGVVADSLVEAVRMSDCPWIINTIGKIPQRTEDSDQFYQMNSLFPAHLALRLRPDQKMIHASTDCVFSGNHAPYLVDAPPDATEPYGRSKALGEIVAEPGRVVVIRCSVIGPEQGTTAGLLSWFLNSTQKNVTGFTNQLWSGLTTLEWAKLAVEMMQRENPPGLIQPGIRTALSKFALLEKINAIWERNVVLTSGTGTEKNMTLVPTHPRANIQTQLEELRKWTEANPVLATQGRVP